MIEIEWSRVRVVSWDVDGTLYSMRRMIARFAWLAARGLLSPATWRDLLLLCRLKTAMNRVRRAGTRLDPAALPADPPTLRAVQARWYGRAIADVGPLEGLAATLDALRARGLRQVVLSDYESDYKLEGLGLAAKFDAVFSGERFGLLKPAPELFRIVCRELGIAPQSLLHVGDLPHRDAAAAPEVGFQAAIVGRDFRSPCELLEGAPPCPAP